MTEATVRPQSDIIVVNLSGRGDKDLAIVFNHLERRSVG
jgi:tryptophan synthase beta subunit